jgi:hypothetical protein
MGRAATCREVWTRTFDGIFQDNDGVLMETEHLYYQVAGVEDGNGGAGGQAL